MGVLPIFRKPSLHGVSARGQHRKALLCAMNASIQVLGWGVYSTTVAHIGTG